MMMPFGLSHIPHASAVHGTIGPTQYYIQAGCQIILRCDEEAGQLQYTTFRSLVTGAHGEGLRAIP
jgi:hypothetical protein